MKQTLSIYSNNNMIHCRGRIVDFGKDERLGSYLTIFIRNYQANRHTSVRFYTQQDVRRKYKVGDHVKVVAHFDTIILVTTEIKKRFACSFVSWIRFKQKQVLYHFTLEKSWALPEEKPVSYAL